MMHRSSQLAAGRIVTATAMNLRSLILLGVGLLLSACGNLEWPPSSGQVYAPPGASRPAATQSLTRRTGGMVLVKQGDTLYSLSLRHKVSIRGLIDANGVRPPYNLRPGQRLVLPAPQEHVVVRGDTLYGISRQYGVDVSTLARVNRVLPPYRIDVGQRLRLPDATGPSQVATRVAVQRPATGPPTAAPRPAAKPRVRVPPPPAKQGGGFAWPLRGKVLSRFGPKQGGLHNDGINIAAPKGTPIRAAENGIVAYAGNELRGFGNLLLIRHSGGWITAYAHADALLVRRGDKINKGQVVARVGATGNVVSPQLHFEIRKGKQAVNPLRHLTAGLGRSGVDFAALDGLTEPSR